MKEFFKAHIAPLFGIALVMVIACTFIACDDGNGNNAITITGIDGRSGQVRLLLLKQYRGPDRYAFTSTKEISGNSVTFEGTWPSGSYCLELQFLTSSGAEGDPYFYTNGRTLSALNISDGELATWNESLDNLPKYTVSSKPSTISFSQFKLYRERNY